MSRSPFDAAWRTVALLGYLLPWGVACGNEVDAVGTAWPSGAGGEGGRAGADGGSGGLGGTPIFRSADAGPCGRPCHPGLVCDVVAHRCAARATCDNPEATGQFLCFTPDDLLSGARGPKIDGPYVSAECPPADRLRGTLRDPNTLPGGEGCYDFAVCGPVRGQTDSGAPVCCYVIDTICGV